MAPRGENRKRTARKESFFSQETSLWTRLEMLSKVTIKHVDVWEEGSENQTVHTIHCALQNSHPFFFFFFFFFSLTILESVKTQTSCTNCQIADNNRSCTPTSTKQQCATTYTTGHETLKKKKKKREKKTGIRFLDKSRDDVCVCECASEETEFLKKYIKIARASNENRVSRSCDN